MIIMLIMIGCWLGFTEEPKMDYSEAWKILEEERMRGNNNV